MKKKTQGYGDFGAFVQLCVFAILVHPVATRWTGLRNSRQPWISHTGNCNKLCEHNFYCVFTRKYDKDICILKIALSKYDHHFAIKGTFIVKIVI